MRAAGRGWEKSAKKLMLVLKHMPEESKREAACKGEESRLSKTKEMRIDIRTGVAFAGKVVFALTTFALACANEWTDL
jgi:hypothetical protein